MTLKDGRTIAADAVVVAIGIRPSADLARDAGIAVKRGIVVDDALETSVAGIHAIGECAEHRGICYGLVEPAHEQARVLADRLAGREAHYAGSVLATNLKVSGVNVFSAGDFLGARRHRGDRCSPIRASASTRSSSSRTAASSARCCSAIPPTGSGIST